MTEKAVSPEREAAEIARLEAETAKFNAEAEAAQRAGQRSLAEARKAAAEAVFSEIAVAVESRSEKDRLADDGYHNVYWFDQGVSDASARHCIRTLRTWHKQDSTAPIKIVFLSPGGSVIPGMALFDEIASLSKRGGGTHEVTTVIRGYAASMAGILLQSGDIRVCGPESYLMIHEIAAGASGKIGEIVDAVKFYEKIGERVVDIFVNRSDGKISKNTFKKNWLRQDWWLSSDESLERGFVDKVE